MHILVVNCGSSSIKYQLIDIKQEQRLLQKAIEITQKSDIKSAVIQLLDECKAYTIDAVGHRVVHGGPSRHAQTLDETVIEQIRQYSHLAPLHNPHNLAGILACRQALPEVPHIAVFDTAFHSGLPRRASTYAIPQDIAEKHDIRRYGFHGTSHSYVAEVAAQHLGQAVSDLRIISLHLGNGASACAIEFGHSTETSMGMTPMEGLVMGGRSGDIDSGIIFTLMREAGMSLDDVEQMLNHQSGLQGLSGISYDMRILESEAAKGNDKARLAINVFAHRIRKYIGAYAATMGGLDAIIVTGGIGENSASTRQRILQRMEFLGLIIDDDKNLDAKVSFQEDVFAIHRPHSRVKVLVIKTNEELKIARQVHTIVDLRHEVSNPNRIPIAVSARHLHLTQETFAQLFGERHTPTHRKDLVQPGQYACEETVTLIGPKGRIEGVRLLGPLRRYNQVEISRTDEFLLGIDAPVRDSGKVKGSAPITLEGPHGTVHLEQGLICAHRHIHMHPDDARRFNVEDGDTVEVAINGGVRDLIFGDVMIRVHPNFALEMHIDTDEANAAELSTGTDASIVYSSVNSASANLRINKTNI